MLTEDGKHLYVSYDEYHNQIEKLAIKIHQSGWQFDTILCLARGGMRPGAILSRIFDKPLAIMSTSSYRADAGKVQGHLDIARYITKGGNLMVNGKTHMRYKVSFDQEDLGYEAMMISDGWRKKGSPIQIESKSEGLEDVRSLTGQETLFHAEAIDELMGEKRNRQGYVFSA